jgi:hypothetical protein
MTLDLVPTLKPTAIAVVCIGQAGISMQTHQGRCYQWPLGGSPTWEDEAAEYAKAFASIGIPRLRYYGADVEMKKRRSRKAKASKGSESASA